MRPRWLPVTVWVFFALSSLIGAIVGLFGAAAAAPQPGPGGPLEGVAYGLALGLTALSAILFILCLFVRPPAEDFTARNWIIAIGSCATVFTGFRLATHSGRYSLTMRIVDPSAQPVSGATFDYHTFPLGEGIGRLDHQTQGLVQSDSNGVISIRTNHAHMVSGVFRKPGFTNTDFQLSAAGHRYPHQIVSPAWGMGVSVERPSDFYFDKQSGLLIPPHGDIALRVIVNKQ